jgi:bifunctional N-acetylglucosamine-1-phosphate-uridyltransferase/glucosamine-1-phosphate-acetyltransferase GlmU-like protein
MKPLSGALLTRDEAASYETDWQPAPAATRALIAAAGRGTRLGHPLPKVLYPVNGRPLIAWLAERLNGLVGGLTMVLSPDGADAFAAEAPHLALPTTTAVQHDPTGMADAILAAEPSIARDGHSTIVVLWGDQIGVQHETIARALAVHARHPAGPAVTIPLARVDAPYVHYEFNAAGHLTAVLQRREGDQLPASGLADCGCFVITPAAVFPVLHRLRTAGLLLGRLSHEQNFLQALPFLARETAIVGVSGASPANTIGLNSSADLERLTRAASRPTSSQQ